jgi:hypothetical protein
VILGLGSIPLGGYQTFSPIPIPFLLIAVKAPVKPAKPILAKILEPGSVEL